MKYIVAILCVYVLFSCQKETPENINNKIDFSKAKIIHTQGLLGDIDSVIVYN